MNTVVVEDDLNKLQQISELIRRELGNVELVERHSYQSGLKEIVRTRPDVAIVDMTMPTFDISPGEPGGRIRAYAGREILAEIERRGLPTKVIVVTQFETFFDQGGKVTLTELKSHLASQFPSNYVGTVYYNAAETSWRQELLNALRGCEAR